MTFLSSVCQREEEENRIYTSLERDLPLNTTKKMFFSPSSAWQAFKCWVTVHWEFIICKCKIPAIIYAGRKISCNVPTPKFAWKFKVSFVFPALRRIPFDSVPPSIDQIERHYTGFLGQSIKLSCQANGIPIPTITWHGISNASGTAIIDSFGNLYVDQLE